MIKPDSEFYIFPGLINISQLKKAFASQLYLQNKLPSLLLHLMATNIHKIHLDWPHFSIAQGLMKYKHKMVYVTISRFIIIFLFLAVFFY